ncbi:MAG TPA: sigma-70 family RNA polymerase sigma factor [Terriglobales bacterium]|jgi:RNA polymerase sigma-70 factor (ECF subfamily)
MARDAQPLVEISQAVVSLVAELHEKSGGSRFGLSQERFTAILEQIASKYLPAGSSTHDLRELYSSLRIEDLVLARACAEGNERAWEAFMLRFREKLYDIAAYVTRESSSARELADGIYADLYGTASRDGQRVSKLASYTGRGSLEGWLRTVIAQEYVNKYRRQRRLVSLDEETEEGGQFAAKDSDPVVPVDSRLEAAVDEALAALPPDGRLVLASYYLDGRTLAEIARMLSVHESTISRKLDKLAAALRKQIIAGLVRRGMDRRQAQEALEVDVRDVNVSVRKRLAQESEVQTFPKQKAEAGEDPA